MRGSPYISNDGQYMAYYTNQAGYALPGFTGSATQYGTGLGGMFRSLFRFAMPLLKSGFTMAKPHLKTAAKNIVGDVITHMVNRPSKPQQEGSGLMYRHTRGIKRPPRARSQGRVLKRRKIYKRASVSRKKKRKAKHPTRRTTRPSARDIF